MTKNTKPNLAERRRNAVLALGLVFFTGLFVIHGPAWSVELDHPSSVINTDETTLPIITSPTPTQAKNDSCLPLLKSVRQASPSAMDRNRSTTGKAAALGVIFGVRFALGPKEVMKSSRRDKAVRFDLWQAREGNGAQAMAIADYRRCKNEEALKAISDWRWAR